MRTRYSNIIQHSVRDMSLIGFSLKLYSKAFYFPAHYEVVIELLFCVEYRLLLKQLHCIMAVFGSISRDDMMESDVAHYILQIQHTFLSQRLCGWTCTMIKHGPTM